MRVLSRPPVAHTTWISFERFNNTVYHDPIPSATELRLPTGVALLEIRPYVGPAADTITPISIAINEQRKEACCVS